MSKLNKNINLKIDKPQTIIGLILVICSIFLLIGFIWASVIPYLQARTYIKDSAKGQWDKIFVNSFIFSPHTQAQQAICLDIFKTIQINPYAETESEKQELMQKSGWIEQGLERCQPLVLAAGYPDPTQYAFLAQAHDELGQLYKDQNNEIQASLEFQRAEEFHQLILSLAPNREEFKSMYAVHLAFEGNVAEAIQRFRDILKVSPDFSTAHFYLGTFLTIQGEKNYPEAFDQMEIAFSKPNSSSGLDPRTAESVYGRFMVYFYKQQDLDRFYKSVKRQIGWDSAQKEMYQQIVTYMDQYHKLPVLNFQEL